MIKKIKGVLLLLLSAYFMLFFSARYAWRLRGFEGCNDLNAYFVSVIDIAKDQIILKSDTSSSASAYIGNYYTIEGNRLYIGLKYNNMLGFMNRDSGGEIEIHCDTTTISEIVQKDFKEEKVIWKKAGST